MLTAKTLETMTLNELESLANGTDKQIRTLLDESYLIAKALQAKRPTPPPAETGGPSCDKGAWTV